MSKFEKKPPLGKPYPISPFYLGIWRPYNLWNDFEEKEDEWEKKEQVPESSFSKFEE